MKNSRRVERPWSTFSVIWFFFLPFCAIIGWLSLDYVSYSYNTGERSDYGGLDDRYLVKTILPIGFAVLALSGDRAGSGQSGHTV